MAHKLTKRIHYHDTDCGGVVYYANYLKYFEEGRAEYMRERGIDLKSWQAGGVQFAVRRAEVDYRYPARYGDLVSVESTVTGIKNASLTFSQKVMLAQRLCVEAVIVLVCVGRDFRPASIPEEMAKALR